jgi:hypothetical protein
VTVFAFLSGEICTEDLAGKRRPFRVRNDVCDEASRPIRDIQVGHKAEKLAHKNREFPHGGKNQDGRCKSKIRYLRRKLGAIRSGYTILGH